jgi:hypothetical protein
VRRTVPPSAEIRASIDKLLSTVDNGGDAAHRPAKRAVTRVGASCRSPVPYSTGPTPRAESRSPSQLSVHQRTPRAPR